MKKIFALVLACAMLLSMAAVSTALAEDKPFEGTTITVWLGKTEYNSVTEELMNKWAEENGVTFEVEINPGGTEGDNIMKTRCASDDLPDLMNYNSGSLLTALNPKNHFYDMTDAPMTERFDDTFKSVVMQDGRVYGAPFTTTQAGACVYWKPDYEELGLEVPTTWDAFLENCAKLKEAGKTPVMLSCGTTWTTQVLFLGDNYNVLAAEPGFAEGFTAGTAKFADTEAGVASWNKYGDLIDYLNADATAATYDDALEAMSTGQATHWFILTQVVPTMIEMHPECEDKLGVFAIPGVDPENTGLTVWEPNAWYISKDSENAEAALAFLEYWFEKDTMDYYFTTYGANGPSCIKGYTLPDNVAPAIKNDMQAYFDVGHTAPALEFLTPVKGATCEQITTSAALGQIDGATAAKMYDDDCKKSAMQQGLAW